MTDTKKDVVRAPTRRDPLALSGDPFSAFRREMDRLFDDFMGGRDWMMRPWSTWDPLPHEPMGDLMPRVDVREETDKVVVTAELPGLTHEDIDLELKDDVLMLKGEKRSGDSYEDDNMRVSERRFGSFARSFRLPEGCDLEHIEAAVEKGVLTVTVPKVPEAIPETRKITVEAA